MRNDNCRVLVNNDESSWLKAERWPSMAAAIQYNDPFQHEPLQGAWNVMSVLHYVYGYGADVFVEPMRIEPVDFVF